MLWHFNALFLLSVACLLFNERRRKKYNNNIFQVRGSTVYVQTLVPALLHLPVNFE